MHYLKICPFIPIAPILKQCEIIAVTSNNHLKKNSVTESIELFSVRELPINMIFVHHFQKLLVNNDIPWCCHLLSHLLCSQFGFIHPGVIKV